MTREALYAFRKNAQKNNDRSSSATNYFTVKYTEGKRRTQPADWIPTCIATEWCENHGPCLHATADCKPKRKIDPVDRFRIREQVGTFHRFL